MCFIGEKQKSQRLKDIKPLIAKKEFAVYKVLENNNLSPYFNMLYEKGSHYYDDKPFRLKLYYGSKEKFRIDKGLHCYSSLTKSLHEKIYIHDAKIVKMYIPKGAKYFINRGFIVTSDLIWY